MKTVLITGGARRLGRALVEHFAAEGWQVLMTAQRSFEDAVLLVDAHKANVQCVRSILSTQANASLIANWASKHTDKLDLVICNASSFKRLPVADTTQDEFENLLGSNLIGPFFLAQQCLAMLKAGSGSIINIADAQVTKGMPQFAAYAAAKAGLISITKSMAHEFSPDIRVNAILPGTLQWPENDIYSPDAQLEMTAQIPMGRIGEWNDIIQGVKFLDESKFSTGSCLVIDGGANS